MVPMVETEHHLETGMGTLGLHDAMDILQVPARRLLTEDMSPVFEGVYAYFRGEPIG